MHISTSRFMPAAGRSAGFLAIRDASDLAGLFDGPVVLVAAGVATGARFRSCRGVFRGPCRGSCITRTRALP